MSSCILIVEDHAIVREPLARLLRLEGYRTLCAGNGNEAAAMLESDPVDLVLLDLIMPKKTAWRFWSSSRATRAGGRLPVILMTGVIEGSLLDRARAFSATTVLSKARFTVDELLARIRGCLEE